MLFRRLLSSDVHQVMSYVLGHNIDFQVHRCAGLVLADYGLLQRVRDDRNRNRPARSNPGDCQTHAINGYGPFFNRVYKNFLGHLDGQKAVAEIFASRVLPAYPLEGHNPAHTIDVTLHDVPPERRFGCRRWFQVDGASFVDLPERRSAERLSYGRKRKSVIDGLTLTLLLTCNGSSVSYGSQMT